MTVEKMSQTIALCNSYSDWYNDYKATDTSSKTFDKSLKELKRWLTIDTSIRKDNDTIKMDVLKKNGSIVKLLSYFETATQLHKSKLLDTAYFNNKFKNTFKRIDNVINPKMSEYIDAIREQQHDTTKSIWDGYYYCDTVIIHPRKMQLGIYDKIRNYMYPSK